ncbi:MAG: hypothetical protein PVF58_14275 [Candidatus Methanofastidiosia archaeon]|jgi:hypothetical protein
MATPYDISDRIVITAEYLDSPRVASYLERKIRGDLTLEASPVDLANILMPIDTTLTTRISNQLDLVEIPRPNAVYGGTEDVAIPITTPAIDEANIKAWRLAAKSAYPFKAGKDPEYRSKMDMAAMDGITVKRNQKRVEGIIANVGTITVEPESPGSVTMDDLYNMDAEIQVSDSETAGREGEGGNMTNLLFHPRDWADIRKDPKTGDRMRTELVQTFTQGGALHKFDSLPYKALVTNHATQGTVIGWDFDRYMLEVVSVALQEFPYDDSKVSSAGFAKGTKFFGMVGFGTKVHGDEYVVSMNINPE